MHLIQCSLYRSTSDHSATWIPPLNLYLMTWALSTKSHQSPVTQSKFLGQTIQPAPPGSGFHHHSTPLQPGKARSLWKGFLKFTHSQASSTSRSRGELHSSMLLQLSKQNNEFWRSFMITSYQILQYFLPFHCNQESHVFQRSSYKRTEPLTGFISIAYFIQVVQGLRNKLFAQF